MHQIPFGWDVAASPKPQQPKVSANCLSQETINKCHFIILAKAQPSSEPDLKHENRNKAWNVDHTVC